MKDTEIIVVQNTLHDVLCKLQIVSNTIAPGAEISEDERDGCFLVLMDCVEDILAVDHKLENAKTPIDMKKFREIVNMPDCGVLSDNGTGPRKYIEINNELQEAA